MKRGNFYGRRGGSIGSSLKSSANRIRYGSLHIWFGEIKCYFLVTLQNPMHFVDNFEDQIKQDKLSIKKNTVRGGTI